MKSGEAFEESGDCSSLVSVPKIAIVGPGALGCLLAVSARRAGWSVEFYGRNTEEARSGSIQVAVESALTNPGGESGFEVYQVPLDLSSNLPERAKDHRWIAVCVKSHQSAELVDVLGACGDRPWVLFQNGLEGFDGLGRALPGSEGHGALTRRGAALTESRLGLRRLRLGGVGPTLLAPLTGSFARTEALARDLCQLSWEVEAVADLRPALWGKLAVNAAINALTLILNIPNGQLLESQEAMSLADEAAREAWSVARAQGVEPLGRVDEWRSVAKATAKNRSSSLQDRDRQRRSEVPAINGAISRLAGELGMRTPVNDILSRLTLALEASVAAHLSPQPAKDLSPQGTTGGIAAQQADNSGSMEPRARRMNGEATP